MRRIIFFTLIVGALIYSACTGNNEHKKQLEEELRLFKAKTITLPDNMLPKHCDEQMQPDVSLLSRPLKMIVYVNQSGCEDCRLRALIPVYMFILENRHIEKFGVIIILNPSDIEITDYTLTDMSFRHTVFYDLDGSFERLNPHLPTDEQLHTFLLNEENKVVLAGNPVQNEKLKKLYFAELNK